MGNPPWERHQGVKKKEKGQGVGRWKAAGISVRKQIQFKTPFMLQLLPASPGSPVLVLEPLPSA